MSIFGGKMDNQRKRLLGPADLAAMVIFMLVIAAIAFYLDPLITGIPSSSGEWEDFSVTAISVLWPWPFVFALHYNAFRKWEKASKYGDQEYLTQIHAKSRKWVFTQYYLCIGWGVLMLLGIAA